jgi:hypothetical protein
MSGLTPPRLLPAPRIAGLLPALVPTRPAQPLTVSIAADRVPSTLRTPLAHAAEALLAEAAAYLAGECRTPTLHQACAAFADTLVTLRAGASPAMPPAVPDPPGLPILARTPYPSRETLDAALDPLCQRIAGQLVVLDTLRALRGGVR